jgi:ABC-type transport system involved in cytochrome bd biosynthesis fused ATPase/permease subunit
MRASNAAWPSLAIVLVITIMGGLAGRISPVSDLALLPPLFFIIFAVFKDVKQIVEAVVDLTLVRNSFQRLAAYQLPIPHLLDWVDIGESETPLQSVEFDAVGYSYDADPVDGVKGRGLENISLQLNIPGWVALTGPSGSGKSTFLDLLIREILPHRGDIRYSPGPRPVTRARLPRHISFMPQSPSLFRGSVRDNLSIQLPARLQDQPNAWLSNKSLITLLQASGLAGRLSSKARSLNPDLAPDDALRAGLELDIGLFNSGWSGGEVKLIGLVRCLASGAEVVVLDEPTASLDESASITVAELLRNEATTRLVLTVTHDPILRQFADRVIELENGRLRPL